MNPADEIPIFLIDIGGTFTDCLAKLPGQPWHQQKFLSTSTLQGRLKTQQASDSLCLPPNLHPRANFFAGYQFQLISPSRDREPVFSAAITSYDPASGCCQFDRPLKGIPNSDQPLRWLIQSPEPSPLLAIRWQLGLMLTDAIGPVRLQLGTTLATNALLEGRGGRVGLITSPGFSDLPRIADQTRAELFNLSQSPRIKLYDQAAEAEECINAQGEIVTPLQLEPLRRIFATWRDQGLESLAICLKHAYRQPCHEQLIAQLASELGFKHIELSHQVSQVQNYNERMQTTLLEAYINPLIRQNLAAMQAKLPQAEFKVMASHGGLVRAADFHAKDSVISGPAGGALGAWHVAQQAGISKVVAFDMGGTSTDVTLIDHELKYRQKQTITVGSADRQLTISNPALAIDTVAAGGGSICWFDGIQLRVGPQSAGAAPGPACYGQNGPLTVTDLMVYLGRVTAVDFPFPLEMQVIDQRLNDLARQIKQQTQQTLEPAALAEGLVKIAVETMASPIKKLAIAGGHRLNDFALISFGGSGSQLALELAENLGIDHVLVSPFSSVLSAYGIGRAPLKKVVRQTATGRLNQNTVPDNSRQTAHKLNESLKAQADPHLPMHLQTFFELRYAGQDSTLTLAADTHDLRRSFDREHERLFGFSFNERPLEVRQVIVELSQEAQHQPIAASNAEPSLPTEPAKEFLSSLIDRQKQSIPVFDGLTISHNKRQSGPMLIRFPGTSVFVKPDWQGCSADGKILQLTHHSPATSDTKEAQLWTDPVQLSLTSHKITAIAEEMGSLLAKTAISLNIKERHDFSCAIFTAEGQLIVNAPHIPVHLGAMSETIQALLHKNIKLQPGDVYACNHPYEGGSHLPDVTVISPQFDSQGQSLLYFVANRAHHAEIGGIRPGSMPAAAKHLDEEGVIIPFTKIADQSGFYENTLHSLLISAPYPSRDPGENIADLKAQIAANRLGLRLLQDLFPQTQNQDFGTFSQALLRLTERKVQRFCWQLPETNYRFRDKMDDGSPIEVSITIAGDRPANCRIHFDFTGTGPQSSGNLNANRAITKAAILYCLRCLLAEDIPLNDGFFRPIVLTIPKGSLLNPIPRDETFPAVVGGNVEISQRLCDVVLAAFHYAAASQGTMNNLILGDTKGQLRLYETIAGGMGGNQQGPGSDAVQVHMTNTRITDCEVLEERYPIRVIEFAIRKGSGGAGQRPGGDGVCRTLEALADLKVSLLTQRRTHPPFGLNGGHNGLTGQNRLKRRGEEDWQTLPNQVDCELHCGDRLQILTPGGGGLGHLPHPKSTSRTLH
jgi:5-oxoprolinase (ATP-hydrolysing)